MKLSARMLSRLGPNGCFGLAMNELASVYDNLAVFTADLQNFSGLDRFAELNQDKMFDVGIAEQNLIGAAAGYASEGNIVYASTYASFASMRDLDQVSVNMAYMKLNVKLIGLNSGFSTGILGATHICINDLAIMQAFPNISILSPADGIEVYKMTIAAAKIDGPVYMRLTGTMNMPIVYKEDYDLQVGKANKLRDGEDFTIIATGSMVHVSVEVAEILEEKRIYPTVLDMHTIRPLDFDAIFEAAGRGTIVTVEEHGVIGGLGDAVGRFIREKGLNAKLLNIGVPCEYSKAARYQTLLDKYGLNAEEISKKILQFIGTKR